MSHHNVQQDDKYHKLTCLTITEWIRWSCTPQVDICLPLQNISFLWRLSNCFDNLFHWKQSVWLCDSRTMRNRGGQIFRKWEIRKDMKQMFKTDKQADTNKMRTLQHEDYSDCLMNVESKTSFSVHVVGKDVVTRTKSGGGEKSFQCQVQKGTKGMSGPLTPPSLLAFMSVCHPSWPLTTMTSAAATTQQDSEEGKDGFSECKWWRAARGDVQYENYENSSGGGRGKDFNGMKGGKFVSRCVVRAVIKRQTGKCKTGLSCWLLSAEQDMSSELCSWRRQRWKRGQRATLHLHRDRPVEHIPQFGKVIFHSSHSIYNRQFMTFVGELSLRPSPMTWQSCSK